MRLIIINIDEEEENYIKKMYRFFQNSIWNLFICHFILFLFVYL